MSTSPGMVRKLGGTVLYSSMVNWLGFEHQENVVTIGRVGAGGGVGVGAVGRLSVAQLRARPGPMGRVGIGAGLASVSTGARMVTGIAGGGTIGGAAAMGVGAVLSAGNSAGRLP